MRINSACTPGIFLEEKKMMLRAILHFAKIVTQPFTQPGPMPEANSGAKKGGR